MKKTHSPLSTKDRLLHAAIPLFAARGYEGASTREISKAAQTNISSILYYFEGKEGLYQKVLEHIAGVVQAEMVVKMHRARQLLEHGDLLDADCRAIAHDLFASFIRFLLGDTISPAMVRLFLREQSEPSPSFALLYEKVMRPFHETLTLLIARLSGLPFPSAQATLCAQTILGSITIFKTHRELTMRRMGWKKYGEKELAEITEMVLRHADVITASYRRA